MNSAIRDILKDVRDFKNSDESLGYALRLDLSGFIAEFLSKNKGMTQAKLAEAVGMKSPSITKIIHASSNCTFQTAERLSRAMGIKLRLVKVDDVSVVATKAAVSCAVAVVGFGGNSIQETGHGQSEIKSVAFSNNKAHDEPAYAYQ